MNTTFDKMIQLYKAGFRQQHEATCGPASIILAAMGLGLEYKQELEWVDNSFAQWLPVDQFLERGMALHELCFISEMIFQSRLEITAKRAYQENFSLFLSDVKKSFQAQDRVIIVNYRQDDFVNNSSASFGGNPHYSPIVGWNAKEKKVLICDIDAVIQDLYWLSIEKLFQSMSQYNPAFNLPRGWLVIKKRIC